MQTIPFREVLYGVAEKFGLDPTQSNFLSNQAIPVGGYINEWVRRTYPGADYPEWTLIHKFAPNAQHIVTWNAVAIDDPLSPVLQSFWRVLEVYLVDPGTTDAPVGTRFTLREEGVHAGYEHGQSVWIKFSSVPPKFTAEVWISDFQYARDQVVYSYRTGECYKSRVGSNQGNDPGASIEGFLPAVTTSTFSPGTPPPPPQPKIVRVLYHSVNPLNTGDKVVVSVQDATGILANVTYTSVATATATDTAFANIRTQLIAALPGTWTITQDTTNDYLTLQNASNYAVNAQWTTFGGPDVYLDVSQIQPHIPSYPSTPPRQQITEVIFSQSQVVPMATYRLVLTDSSGMNHGVQYVAGANDDGNAIILGLMQAITDSIDPWFSGIYTAINTTSVKLVLSFWQSVGVDASYVTTGSPWWDLVPFPLAIADQVIRGATADLYKEWSQTDKGLAEEGIVPQEKDIATGVFNTQPNPPLTQQQRPLSRYKL